jgi:anaerobic magnesium-protoporphyrin IX monomethyl ester cyclase
MKTLLVTTPNRASPANYPPIGSLALIHYLRKRGYEDFEFYNIDGNRPSYEETLAHILEFKPTVLGISAVVSTAYAYTKMLANDVKRLLPDTLIVVGGNLAASAEILLRKTGTDICVLGEGEIIFHNIIKRAFETTDPTEYTDIPGLVMLDKQGQLVNTGYEAGLSAAETYDVNWKDLEETSDIDHFLYSPFDAEGNPKDGWLKLDPRSYEPHRRDKRVAFLPCVKGCVARCTFCHRFDKGIRHMPNDQVMDQVDVLKNEYNVGFIRLAADTFGADKRWTKEFCARIKERDILWQGTGVRANNVDPETIAMMKDAGCVSLVYGNETGSEKMLQIMEKKLKLEDNYNAMEWTVGANVFTGVQLVVGMPGETPETIKETIKYCEHVCTLSPTQDPNNLSINYAQALPGTPLYEYGRHKGFIGKSIDEEEDYLLSISDKDAHDEHSTLNFTDHPKLGCLTWRPLITVSTNYAYIQKFGIEHYLWGLYEGTGKFLSDQPDSGYSANPKRLVEMGMKGLSSGQAVDRNRGRPPIPGLIELLTKGRFGLALICHPILFYRLRHFLVVLVLLNNIRIRGLGYGMKILGDYLVFHLLPKGKDQLEYKSLRKTVDKDLGNLDIDDLAMVPLRKGR